MSLYKKVITIIFDLFDKIKIKFRQYFVASETDPELVRKKHKRIGYTLLAVIVSLLIGFLFIGNEVDRQKSKPNNKNFTKQNKKLDINKLASGTTNEQIWLETAEKELIELKEKQNTSASEHDNLKKYIEGETINKEELGEILKHFESDMEKKYSDELQNQLKILQQANQEQAIVGSPISMSAPPPQAKIKKIGQYIPAGSYVEANMISGVDAGVGIAAAEDPRQVLLRITGKAVSAGYNKDYLTTDVLMGCLVQCQAVGDLSSEKVYLKPIVMTCAKNAGTIVEIPVKGYVTASGKSGIRGEVVSREGDLVTQSFLSGLVGGLGSGASEYYQPSFALSGGVAVKQSEQLKNVVGTGIGSGLHQSSNRLSDYFIKRAEQYQPVISINEGTKVSLVFQEGFSLSEEEIKNAKS